MFNTAASFWSTNICIITGLDHEDYVPYNDGARYINRATSVFSHFSSLLVTAPTPSEGALPGLYSASDSTPSQYPWENPAQSYGQPAH